MDVFLHDLPKHQNRIKDLFLVLNCICFHLCNNTTIYKLSAPNPYLNLQMENHDGLSYGNQLSLSLSVFVYMKIRHLVNKLKIVINNKLSLATGYTKIE